MKPRWLLLFALLAWPALAAKVNLEWQPTGMASKLRFYRPIKVELGSAKPDGVTKVPEGVAGPRFGAISLGSTEATMNVVLLLDVPESQARHGCGWTAMAMVISPTIHLPHGRRGTPK